MNVREYSEGFNRSSPDQEDIACFEQPAAHAVSAGSLPPRSQHVSAAADALAAVATKRALEISKGTPDAERLAQYDQELGKLLAQQTPLFSSAGLMKNEIVERVAQAYNETRLEAFQETLLGLAIERGRLLGRRHADFEELKKSDERIRCYCEAHKDLLRFYQGGEDVRRKIIEEGQQRGIEKCLSAERAAAELWTLLMGSAERHWFSKPIAKWLARKGTVLLHLTDLSARRRRLVQVFFKERYGRELLETCASLMNKRELEFARDLSQGSTVEAAASGIAYFLSQGKKARRDTKILQEMQQLCSGFSKEDFAALNRNFTERFGESFSAAGLAQAFHKYLPHESEPIACALVAGEYSRVHALLFHRLLQAKPRERKEAADLLEELSEQERCALLDAYPLEFKGQSAKDFAARQLKDNRGLKELVFALFENNELHIKLARLYLGLKGVREEWPGTPFLGKDKNGGAALIAQFDSLFGKRTFKRLLGKYNSADANLVKALIKNKLAPAAEIYFASTNGLGSDIESLRWLLTSSTSAQIRRDEKEYEALWETRASRVTLLAKRLYQRVAPWTEPIIGRSRYVGAFFGNLKDVVWLNSQGDDWKELEVHWNGRTEDVHTLYDRARELVKHELKLPVVSLIRRLSKLAGRELRLELFFSHEAAVLNRDFRLLQRAYEFRFCSGDRKATADEITHFKAMIDRVTTDRLAFRERKRYLGHVFASAGAGIATSITGGYLLLKLKWAVPAVMVAATATDFIVRSSIKTLVKGRESCTGEERFNDLAHSMVNGSTLYLRRAPKAVGLLRRLVADPVLERGG